MNDRAEASSILRESVVVVFVNSAAGGGRASSYLGRMQKLFESFQVHAKFVMTNSAAELESSARNSISHGQRVLFAMGGDGTFQALANAAFGTGALLAILPSEEEMISPPPSGCQPIPGRRPKQSSGA